jgi:hypothetical protein
MTTLEATVEIVKAAIAQSQNNLAVLTMEKDRKNFLEGIEALYKKLEALETGESTQ